MSIVRFPPLALRAPKRVVPDDSEAQATLERLANSAPPTASANAPIARTELPEISGRVEFDAKPGKPGWRTLAIAGALLGLATAGQLSGLTPAPEISRLLGDELIHSYDELAAIGSFDLRDPLDANQAFRKIHWSESYYSAVGYTPEGAARVVLRGHDQVRQAADYLLRAKTTLSPEQLEVVQRVASTQPQWSKDGLAAVLALQAKQAIRYQLDESGNKYVDLQKFEDFELADALFLKTPNGRVDPALGQALVTLQQGSSNTYYSGAFYNLQRLERHEGVFYSYRGGAFDLEYDFGPKTAEEVIDLARRFEQQAEADRYRPSPERIQKAIDPLFAATNRVYQATSQQLEALEGVTGVPADKLQASRQTLADFESKLSELRALFDQHKPGNDARIGELIQRLTATPIPGEGEWWNPWNKARSDDAVRSLRTLERLTKSLDRPEAPEGWQPAADLIEFGGR
ncbi:MAG: hypothetical protein KC910_04660 [Candidatus Eremiobacteraeota bacterium]|nr:hypothetical protein [Candidatus Eremiobacteraeota bacterium]